MQLRRRIARPSGMRELPAPVVLLASFGLVMLTVLGPTGAVQACSCAGFTPEEAADAADVAFTGSVLSEGPSRGPVGLIGANEAAYTFAVDGVVKGEVGAEVTVVAGGDSAACGMTFGVDERWFVAATWEGAALATHLCSGNQPLAGDDPAPLPVEPPSNADPGAGREADGGLPTPLLVVLAGLAVLAVSSALAFRRGGAR